MVLLRLGSTKTWCCAEANASLPETFCVVSGLLPGTICLWLNFIILNATLVSLGSFKNILVTYDSILTPLDSPILAVADVFKLAMLNQK